MFIQTYIMDLNQSSPIFIQKSHFGTNKVCFVCMLKCYYDQIVDIHFFTFS